MNTFRLIVALISMLLPTLVSAATPPDPFNKAQVMNKAYRMQIPFIENKGQVEDSNVSFYARTFGGTVFVGKDGTIAYSFPSGDKGAVVIKEVYTEHKIPVKGLETSATKVNYFKGKDQTKWKTNIPSYNSVSLGEVYNGVELILKAYGKNVEKIFTVLPGVNPDLIKVALEGAKYLKVNEKGELEVLTEHGPIKFTKPLAYQEIDGKRVEVEVAYQLQESEVRNQETKDEKKESGVRSQETEVNNLQPKTRNPKRFSSTLNPEPSPLNYSFRVGDYNKSFPLIIDPLLASTFIGGINVERGVALTLDESGNVFVTGWAEDGFPTTSGAYDETNSGGSPDVIVSKLDSTLSILLASTFMGGNGNDRGRFLTLDEDGNVYVTGVAEDGFPIIPGAYDDSYNGGIRDVFVSKLDSTLSTLLASTFMGGGSDDWGESLVLDESGNVYVTGYAHTGFPITPGVYDETINGGSDVFVSKLNSDLTSLLASTFMGGGGGDFGFSPALDESGNVYVTGRAEDGFPTTSGAYDETFNGGTWDVFVSKLNSDLTSLLASTFMGGGSDDYGYSLTLDGSGNVYVTGAALLGFPTTPGAYDETFNFGVDVFVSKLNSDLTSLLASTFLGGNGANWGYGLTLDGCRNVYVTGYAADGFPTTPGSYGETNNGVNDVFVSKLDSTLSYLLASTYLGGDGLDYGDSLTLDGSGNVYVTGIAQDGFPTTSGAYDETYNSGTYDLFISKLDSDLSADESGLQSASSSFLFDPFAVSLKFDVDQDGIFDIPCTELLLCEGQIVNIDVWLDNWDSVNWGEVESVSYDLTASDFTWNEQVLQVESITCDPQWDGSCTVTHTPGTTTYQLEAEKAFGGFPGPEIRLHTIRLKCIDIVAPIFVTFATDNVSVTSSNPPASLEENPLNVNAICGADSFTCDADDHCERMGYNNLCPDTGVTEKENDYFWRPQGSSTVCEGNTVNIFHVRKGDYPVTEAATETMCDSDCFNKCYDNCGYNEIQVCFLTCVKGCICDHCENWDQEEVCYEYQQRVDCNAECYGQCKQSYDPGEGTAQYSKRCGYNLHEIITISKDSDGDCMTTGTDLESFTLEGIGAAAIGRPMPLDYGTYEICAGTQLIGQPLEVADCSTPVCRIVVPENVLTVDKDVTSTLENVKIESDVDEDYELTLQLNQSPVNVPASLSVPGTASVSGGESLTFPVTATNPLPEGGKYYWPNIVIKAVGPSLTCTAAFDYYISADEDEDGVPSADDNCPDTSNQLQEDTYPTQGNNIGDACDCEADFNCDGNVDGGDVGDFITDFGRSTYFNPCSNQDQCLGDFNCDVNVDGGDVGIFIEDFGRSTYFNPCPACVAGEWCNY